MLKHFAVGTALALFALPTAAFSQSCSRIEVYQEFSYEDTFNSAGSPINAGYAVFQQDRFYVNQQGRVDPFDAPDPVMVNREARSSYGRAVQAFMNANGTGDMPAQALIGSQYIVELEACGPNENPSIQIIAMRLMSDIEDDSWEIELEYRNAELAEWEQRLNKREADLDEWERQLGDWDRRLSEMQYNLEQQVEQALTTAPIDGEEPQTPGTSSIQNVTGPSPSRLPRTARIPLSTGGVGENPLSVCWGYVEFMFSLRADAESEATLEHLDFNESGVQRQWSIDTGMTQDDWQTGLFGGIITARSHASSEFDGIVQTLESCTNLMALYMDYVAEN